MKRSKHNLSHYRLLTGNMGKLYPCGLVEVLPGDSFQHHTNVLLRLSPMVAPVMHGMTLRVHHWYVPHRLVWDGFEEFITGGKDGMNADSPPQLTTTGVADDLLDYFGIPRVAGVSISALPIRAFNKIYNEFYRDQDLVPERVEDDVTVPNIAWEKDYFTTCRPWEQKGPEVTIPLGTSAPISALGDFSLKSSGSAGPDVVTVGSGATLMMAGSAAGNTSYNGGLLADLSTATAASVNELRRAFAIQRFQEARARYGSRYTEYLRYLGVTPSDGRLDEPEYIGGGKVTVSVSEVLQTAPETDLAADEYGVGDMYGHGIAALRSNRYRRFFEEHGYVLTLVSVRPRAVYMDGIHRTWLRMDKEDFFQKELQYIGQQAVLKNEVYADSATGGNVWGYQDRYRDYREVPSGVSGQFRDVLNFWHMARDFDQAPALNQAFVECDPTKRIFNVQSEDVLWMMVQHRLTARRMVDRSAAPRIL